MGGTFCATISDGEVYAEQSRSITHFNVQNNTGQREAKFISNLKHQISNTKCQNAIITKYWA